ncbi:MAG: hypothetical protein NT126_04210 [Bacteroidetes bacterium]|nr:hypothetical protein [Bacteroidota bacterium]
MERSDKHQAIFSGSHHFTHDELIRYVHHMMNEKQQHEMEKHLVDCTLCSEALKGVAEMENASLLYEVSRELHHRARKKHLLKRRIFSQNELLAIFSVVFLVLFLLLMSVFFFQKKNPGKPQEEKNKMERKK